MKKHNYYIIIAFIIGAILTAIFNWLMPEPTFSAIQPIKCPVCPSRQITASKIIRDNPTIDMTKYNTGTKFKIPDIEGLEVQIGKDTYTKNQIKTLNTIK